MEQDQHFLMDILTCTQMNANAGTQLTKLLSGVSTVFIFTILMLIGVHR